MTTSYIITFYGIFIPVVILVIFAGFIIGYKLGKTHKMFPHTKSKNGKNANK